MIIATSKHHLLRPRTGRDRSQHLLTPVIPVITDGVFLAPLSPAKYRSGDGLQQLRALVVLAVSDVGLPPQQDHA